MCVIVVAINMFSLNIRELCQTDTVWGSLNLDMFGIAIGIETVWPTSKSIPITIPIPIILQRSVAYTIHKSERNSVNCVLSC